MSDDLTVSWSVCAICDKGRDPLDVPSEPCGHSRQQARLVSIPVAPMAERDALAARVEELEARIARALAAASEPAGWSKARRILRGEDDTSSTERTE